MSPSGSVLWVDNDPGYIRAFVTALERAGYDVTVIKKVTAAEELLRSKRFNLLILDAMIPTLSETEEAAYPPADTDNGHKTGLVFYRRNKEIIDNAKTPVLVFTVRIDKPIRNEFLQCGLPPASFVTKMDLKDTADFMHKIKEVVRH